ncbi:MAG: PAS domain S-box protein [Mariprofundus sp.]|nr:PAS domain S-box protein [Mariprofundus sp.]
MISELLIMSAFHVLIDGPTPWFVDMLDVVLLGLITAVVAQLWIVRPLTQAREQDAFFRNIAEHSHAGLVITDPTHDHAIVYVNAAFSEITGYSMAEIKGKSPGFLAQGIERQPDQDKISAALKAVQPVRALLKNKRKDGSIFWNDLHLSPISIDGDKANYWLALLHDVSETRALNAQLDHLVGAVDQACDLICMFDQQGRIDFINQAFIRHVGLDKEQLEGTSVWHFWCDEIWTEELVQNALLKEGQWSGRNRWQRADQEPYDAMTNITVIENEDGQRMYIAVIRDMTEEIEMGNKLVHAQKMEAVGTLAGGIAHDFNNMLAAMMGNLYLLKKNMDEDNSAISRIESIEAQGYRGANLIRQMLVFARKQTVERQDFDLQLLAKETFKLLETSTPENIQLITDVDASSMMIHGDPSLLQSSLFNLVNNARHAIEDAQKAHSGYQGVVSVSILAVPIVSVDKEVQQALTSNNHNLLQYCVHISVTDNGLGMDQTTQARVFEPYFTTKAAGKGTGIGLSMVMGCVELHGGWIGLSSEPDKGTSFDIYLPLIASSQQLKLASDVMIHPGNGQLILLADDNQPFCESIAETLQGAGYRVLMASDGEEALQCYQEHKADIRMAILDCVMPKLGGGELAQMIWQQSGDSVKIILMTGYDLADASGIDWPAGKAPLVLQKPWKLEQLNDVLKSMGENE